MNEKVLLAGKGLDMRADQRLRENGARYGCADRYVDSKTIKQHIRYASGRIAEYLRCLKNDKGADPDVLLADAVNQLRFVQAKYDAEKAAAKAAEDAM